MRKRFIPVLCALVLAVLVVAPATAGTLNALPSWPSEALYGVLNIEESGEFIGTVVDSRPFQLAMAFEPDMEMIAEWLKLFPMQSVSLAVGMSDMGFSLHGAARFDESKDEILQRIAKGEAAEGDLDLLVNNPFPGMVILDSFHDNLYSIVVDDDPTDFLLSVEDGLLIFGFGPDDIADVKAALADPAKRMSIDRKVPQKNFFFFHDNGMAAAEIAAESMGALKEPVGNLTVETGFGLSERGFDLSVFTNFASVFGLDKLEGPLPTLSKDDLVLVGGGTPWLTMAGKAVLEKKHFEMLREAADGGDYDAQEIVDVLEQLKVMGLTEHALISILKSVGLVLGGDSSFSGMPVPGGYLYVSGEKEWVELLLPLLEAVAEESGGLFEPLVVPGWQALYAMREPVEAVIGIRDGVALAGMLSPEALERTPEIPSQTEALLERGDLSLLFHLDASVLRTLAVTFLDPSNPLVAIFLADDDDFLEALPFIFEGLKATAGFDGIQMALSGMERFDLSVLFSDPDAAEIAALDEMSAKWMELMDELDD